MNYPLTQASVSSLSGSHNKQISLHMANAIGALPCPQVKYASVSKFTLLLNNQDTGVQAGGPFYEENGKDLP